MKKPKKICVHDFCISYEGEWKCMDCGEEGATIWIDALRPRFVRPAKRKSRPASHAE